MSSRVSATTGVIDRLDTKEIRVFKDGTPMKWSARLKHRNIILLNSATTAKLSVFQSGNKALLGKDAYVIGTDSQAWSFDIQAGNTIQVGIATEEHSLTNLDPNRDHVSVQLDVVAGDKIVFLLELNELVIEHGESIHNIDLSAHVGKSMHAWLSDIAGGIGFSITLSQYRFIDIRIDVNNIARIVTKTTKSLSIPLNIDTGDQAIGLGNATFEVTGVVTEPGQDFSITSGLTGDGIKVFDADGSIEIDQKLKVNLVQHPGAGPLTLKGSSTATEVITLDINGDLIVGGTLITPCIKAPGGGSTKLSNNVGVGVQVSSGGIVSFDIAPKFDSIESSVGSNLSLVEGSGDLGINIVNTTGTVNITGSKLETASLDKETTGTLNIGGSLQSKLNIGKSGASSEVKGNMDLAEGLSVIGDISVTGSVGGLSLAESISGVVTVHSDVSDVGSGAIITVTERNLIASNGINSTNSVISHSDVSNAGSGLIITAAERTQITTNETNATGSVTIHSDISNVGSGAIITAAERTQLGTNTSNSNGSISAHSDMSIVTPSDLDVISYDIGNVQFENKTLAGAGIAAEVHSHIASDFTNFSAAVDALITFQAGLANGIATLDGSSKVPATQIELDDLEYCGTWNATTNTPPLVSSTGVNGCVYVVSVAGTTTLDGINDWKATDWVVFDTAVWRKVDNSDLVLSVAGKTGVVTLDTADIGDITDVGSGAIITGAERATIGTNAAAIAGTVTVHSDVNDAGSGAIITGAERVAIATNNTNITGTVVVHSDVSDVGSGAIISVAERAAIVGGPTGTATTHADISDAGSGIIISVAERAQIGTNNTNSTGLITVHSDVTDAGSGVIISAAERTQIGTTQTNNSGTVTIHSDVTDAGSGVIISVAERADIGTNTGALPTFMSLSGGTLTGDLNISDNNITNVGDQLVKGAVTLGVTEGTEESKFLVQIGSKTTILSTTASVQWIAPVGTDYIIIKTWGGGGAGSDYNHQTSGRARGGGGGFTYLEYPCSAGDEFWVTIGEGGIHAGSGGFVGAHGQGGSGSSGTFHGGGGGSYTSVHQLSGGNYTLVACSGGGGGGGSGNGSGDNGGGGGGGGGAAGNTGDNGYNGTGASGANGSGAGSGNGEAYGILTRATLDAFGGAGEGTGDGGGGGGGYGGGGAGNQSGGGGGGAGYADPTGQTVVQTAGSYLAANAADGDYVYPKGNSGHGPSSGQHGMAVLWPAYQVINWHERIYKAADGNNIVLSNSSGASSIIIDNDGGVEVKGVVTMSDTTDTSDSVTGSLITAGTGISKNLTVGTVLRLDHQGSSPAAPATDNGYIYVKSGVLYFKGDNGTEQTIALT